MFYQIKKAVQFLANLLPSLKKIKIKVWYAGNTSFICKNKLWPTGPPGGPEIWPMLKLIPDSYSTQKNCNCCQSTISKIAVILSLSFQKSDHFFCSLQTWHTVPHRHSWENRVKILGYFRFEFLILNLIAQLKNFLLGGIFFVIFFI